jgi:oxepin-CoA hydrolase/3-oxo-5,6-dehydrosuberyl-CoA semialdehyde dehydrogenase
MPAIKPATATAQLTGDGEIDCRQRLVPEGAISLICGGAGDLLDHLDSQDVVTFTGSPVPASSCVAPNLVAKSIPFTMEADSLNCCLVKTSRRSSRSSRCLSAKWSAR